MDVPRKPINNDDDIDDATKKTQHSQPDPPLQAQKPISPRILAQPLQWDWSKQRWHGCFIQRSKGPTTPVSARTRTRTRTMTSTTATTKVPVSRDRCNYYDLSDLRNTISKHYCNKKELLEAIILACSGKWHMLNEALRTSPAKLQYGDLIQIGKSKNRNMFIVGRLRLIPITQVLGGNGFGEIPLSFILEKESKDRAPQLLPPDYWTFQNHPIISIVPIDPINSPGSTSCTCRGAPAQQNRLDDNTGTIFLGGRLFTVCNGTNWKHPYFYVDLGNNEFFSLPDAVKIRFENAEKNIIEQLKNALTTDTSTKPIKIKILLKSKPQITIPIRQKVTIIPLKPNTD